MNKVGIICEYNPFHNGHIYHLEKAKELYPDSTIILIMSGNFTQRGIPSIIDKWDKTEIALKYGVDLVVELPFVYATQSADIFAKGSISLLKELKVDTLVFGSELNDINYLERLADIQLSNEYEEEVKKYINSEINYPTILNLAFKKFNMEGLNNPNDLLALSYIKEIKKQNANIRPVSIKRTNNFHSLDLDNICSATSIRNAFIENKDISHSVPQETFDKLNKDYYLLNDYFKLLKYKVISENNLNIYQTVTEDLSIRLKKEIYNSNSWEELVNNIKTKHYTYNRINRMLIHILCNFTKELANSFDGIEYIRVLGFSNKGRKYLNEIKKEVNLPIITTLSKGNSRMLDYEQLTSNIYYSIKNDNSYLKKEYQEKVKRG